MVYLTVAIIGLGRQDEIKRELNRLHSASLHTDVQSHRSAPCNSATGCKRVRNKFNIFLLCTVNFLHSGNCRNLELMSSLTRVRNSGGLFQSINVCNSFLPGLSVCPYYQGVRYSGVSARRELTVYDNVGSVMSSMIPSSKKHGSPVFTSQIKENGVFWWF